MKLIDVECKLCLKVLPDCLVANEVAAGPLTFDQLGNDDVSRCDQCPADEPCFVPTLSVPVTRGHTSWKVR